MIGLCAITLCLQLEDFCFEQVKNSTTHLAFLATGALVSNTGRLSSNITMHSWVTGHFGPIPFRTPGRFGPIPFRSGRFGLGCFGPNSGVSRFGPTGMGRFGLFYFK